MLLIQLLANYFIWHYTLAIKNIFLIWGDFVWFLWNYFSIRQLTGTFFFPWKRLGETATDIFDFYNYFFAIVINLLMRIVGIFIRSVVIISGLMGILLMILSGLVFIVAWFFMPFIVIVVLGVGLKLLTGPF